jgi:hypothetical protein
MKLMGQRGAGLPESLDQFSSRELDRALTYVSQALDRNRWPTSAFRPLIWNLAGGLPGKRGAADELG